MFVAEPGTVLKIMAGSQRLKTVVEFTVSVVVERENVVEFITVIEFMVWLVVERETVVESW